MKKINVLSLIVFLVAACAPAGKISITNIHDLAQYSGNSFIYSVPRSRLILTATAVRHYTVPGPYYQYAEKYLGIEGAISEPKTSWELDRVTMHTMEQPDPDYYFSVQADDPQFVYEEFLKLTNQGLTMRLDDYNPFVQLDNLYEDEPGEIPYTDLSVKRNLIGSGEKQKSSRGDVPTDLPVIKQSAGVKTIGKKAEEAANFIIKIRKRRFKLLAGQYDVFPDGKALEISVKELTKLEEEYLSLFIGKAWSDTIVKTFYFVPRTNQELERHIFCRFSGEEGFQDATGTAGKPLVLELRNLRFTDVLQNIQFPLTGPTYENVLFYRVPDMASAEVFYGSNTILEGELRIFQYGNILPISVLK
ncbi:MAG: DUF4831 family protein [Bacteroidales bacterium]|jgi:hypothetical protein